MNSSSLTAEEAVSIPELRGAVVRMALGSGVDLPVAAAAVRRAAALATPTSVLGLVLDATRWAAGVDSLRVLLDVWAAASGAQAAVVRIDAAAAAPFRGINVRLAAEGYKVRVCVDEAHCAELQAAEMGELQLLEARRQRSEPPVGGVLLVDRPEEAHRSASSSSSRLH